MKFLELLGFKPKNELLSNVLKIEKIFDKEIEKNKKSISFLLKNNKKLQEYISDTINLLDLNDVYSCYNTKLINIISQKLNEDEEVSMALERNPNNHLSQIDRHIDQNVSFMCQGLRNGILILESREIHENTINGIKEKAQLKKGNEAAKNTLKRMNASNKKNFYYDELISLLDEDIDASILDNLLIFILKNIKLVNKRNEELNILFDKIITHKNMTKGILIHFLRIQTINKNENSFKKINGDDIDVNYFKRKIINKELVDEPNIYPLTELPYIELWDTIIESNYANDNVLSMFIHRIKDLHDRNEKMTVRNFILNKIISRNDLSEKILKEIGTSFDFDNELLKKVLMHPNTTTEIRKLLIFSSM